MDENMLCTKNHEYILEKENNFEVGITEYGIQQLGDVVFIELPERDTEFSKGEVFATLESVKSAAEFFMPISGRVIDVNDEIANNPELLSDQSCENKWLIKIESEANQIELVDLLDYFDYIEEFGIN